MKVRTLLITALVVAGGLAGASPASAHRSPAACNANRFAIDISRDREEVRNGDTVNYTVDATNNTGPNGCDVSGLTIQIIFPAKDGTPTGVTKVISVGAAFAGGAASVSLGTFPYIVDVNEGVTDVIARAEANGGVLHDSAADHPLGSFKTVGSVAITPRLTIDKVGSIESGVGPQDVTYNFTVRNASTPPATLDNLKVTDSLCPGVSAKPVSGDVNNDNRLQPDEVWVFTCTMHHEVGTWTNEATVCGEMFYNGTPPGVPVCSPPDTWKVVLTTPPPVPVNAVPQVAVKPVSINRAPCTLARVNSTTVRAGQLNTIRVRVRNVDAGTTVKITLPGTKKAITAKTDKNGLATFKVRPTKTGTAKIEAAECSDVERLSVKPARKVVSQAKPRVTG